MFSQPEFLQLLRSAQKGEKEAQDRLLASMRPFLEGLARGYADPDQAAESTADLVQEAWLRAWQKLDQFRGGEADEEALIRFRAWMAQIVHRLGLNARRDRRTLKRRPEGARVPLDGRGSGGPGEAFLADSQTSPSGQAARSEEAERVRRALEAVPDELQREVLRLRFFEELPLSEIAQRMEMTYDRARGVFSAAMREFEARLEG